MSQPPPSPKMNPVHTDAHGIDVSEAELDPGLSKTGIDTEGESFYATVDRLLFQSPLAVAKKVLESQSYVINLENLLACFDQMIIGAVLKLASPERAKAALPALSFKLPKKGRTGELLQLFYKEISYYERELKKLKDQDSSAGDNSPESLRKARAELKEIKQENQALKLRLAAMNSRLSEMARMKSAADRSLEDKQLLPPDILAAFVRSINWEDRSLSLKSSLGHHSVFLTHALLLPKPQAPCLFDRKTGRAFFYDDSFAAPILIPAKVLHKEGLSFKCRDHQRQLHLIKCKNPEEERRLSKVAVDADVVLYFAEGKLIGFSPLPLDQGEALVERIREESIVGNIDVGTGVPTVHNSEQKEEEAA